MFSDVDTVFQWQSDWPPEYRRQVAERIWELRREGYVGLDAEHGLGDCLECDARRIINSHR